MANFDRVSKFFENEPTDLKTFLAKFDTAPANFDHVRKFFEYEPTADEGEALKPLLAKFEEYGGTLEAANLEDFFTKNLRANTRLGLEIIEQNILPPEAIDSMARLGLDIMWFAVLLSKKSSSHN